MWRQGNVGGPRGTDGPDCALSGSRPLPGSGRVGLADDMQVRVIPGSGHVVAEEAPGEMLAGLTAFLAPYRDGPASPLLQ